MKKLNKEYSIAGATIIGMLITVALLLVFTCIIAMLVLNEVISEAVTVYIEPAVLIIASFIGTSIAMKGIMNGCLLVSGLIAVSALMVQAAINIILFDGMFHRPWMELITIVLGSGLACISKLKLSRKTPHRSKYR